MATVVILIVAIVIFSSKKYIHNENLERFANIATIILFLISILTLLPVLDFPNISLGATATPTLDHFTGIKNPLFFEFTIIDRYSTPGNCSAGEYTANLASGTRFLMEYHLETVSPDYFYACEISGPDYAETLRLEGVDDFLIDRTITNAGKYRIVFSYCAAYALNGTLKISEGDWSATNIEVESTPKP